MEEININKEKNKYRCDICNNPDDYLLCEECFRKYNSGFQENLHNFISTRKSLSKKIDDLIAFNSGKSEKLIKKIMLEKCKEVLENRIKQEETKINKIQEENKKYETPITILKDNISGLKNILKDYGNDSNNEDIKNDIYNSSINLSNLNIGYNNNNNNQISNLKNEIFIINNKIREYKKKYIINLFDELFIKKKAVIKISDFFKNKQYQENNFSVIKISNNMSYNENIDNENDTLISKEIDISRLNNNPILLKRFSSFFKTMIYFLEKAYKKFKIKMPFKINHFKIEYKNGFEYNFEINKIKLNDLSALNSVIKGYHLLNIDYNYLMQNIFGDSIKFNDWFDISKFFEFLEKDYDIGSIDKIIEEAKNDKNQEEFLGFVVLDDEY